MCEDIGTGAFMPAVILCVVWWNLSRCAQACMPSAVRLKVLSHRVERLIQESACADVDLVPQRAILTLWRWSLPWRGSVVSR